jgi:hypothetical protein
MLKIKKSNVLDYDSIFATKSSALKYVKMLRLHYQDNKAVKKGLEEAVGLLNHYGYVGEDQEAILSEAGFIRTDKVVDLSAKFKKDKHYRAIKKHVDFLHDHNALESWITVAHIDYRLAEDGWHQWHYKNSELAEVLSILRSKNTNTYISVNEFYSPFRNVLTLRYITSFYIDIDAHSDEEFDLEAVLEFLEKKYEEGVLPRHSKISFTGRGVQIYWKIELSPSTNLWLWQIIQNFIIEALEDIKDHIKGHEVDKNCSDVTRVFRVDDTYNLKAKCYSRNIEQNDNVYRMNQILEDYFKDKYVAKKKRKNTKNTETRLSSNKEEKKEWVLELNDKVEANFRIMRQRRCEDLKTLLELRQNNLSQGHREYFLFIYAWTAVENITSETTIYRELSSVNLMFADPLKDNEVRGIARKVFKKWSKRSLKTSAKENTWSSLTGRYTFRNRTIIENLEITEEERRHFETIFWDKEEAQFVYNKRRNEAKRKARRNENGLTKREQSKEDKRTTVQELKAQGLSRSQVIKRTGFSESTVKRYWK